MNLLQEGGIVDKFSGHFLELSGPVAIAASLSSVSGLGLALTWLCLSWFAWTAGRLTGVGLLCCIGYLWCSLSGQPPQVTLLITGGTLMGFAISSVFNLMVALHPQRAGD